MLEFTNTPSEWAAYLKKSWDRRSHSDERNFYIAPQGFGNESDWEDQGRHLAESVLSELELPWSLCRCHASTQSSIRYYSEVL